jgi:hypothetical protein
VTTGIAGPENSLIATKADASKFMRAVALPNSSYLVLRPRWDDEVLGINGAVTWCPGTTPHGAVVGPENSLIGADAQFLGEPVAATESPIQVLDDGDYVVRGPKWSAPGMRQRGSLTWGSRNGGVSGRVSIENSFVGSVDDVNLGSYPVIPLPGGSFIGRGISSYSCLVWGDGAGPVSGMPTPDNCLMSPPEDRSGVNLVVDPVNRSYYGSFPDEAESGKVKVGSFDSGGRSIPVISVDLLPDVRLESGASAVDFGLRQAGQSVTRTLRISNKGNWPLEFTGFLPGASSLPPFSVSPSTLTSPLISGRSVTLALAFNSTYSGNFTRSFSIGSTDRISPNFQIELRAKVGPPVSGAGYQVSGWREGSLVIPASRLLGNGKQAGEIVAVAGNTLLGGTVVLDGQNVIYSGPTSGDMDSFVLNIRDSNGVLSTVKATIDLTAMAPLPQNASAFVMKYGDTRSGVQLICPRDELRAIEVSQDLFQWRRLGLRTSDSMGRIRFIDDNAATERGFYRLTEP